MNTRVRRAAVALLAVTLSLNASSVFAAQRDRQTGPGFMDRIGKLIRKVVKPLVPVSMDDNVPMPGPPKP